MAKKLARSRKPSAHQAALVVRVHGGDVTMRRPIGQRLGAWHIRGAVFATTEEAAIARVAFFAGTPVTIIFRYLDRAYIGTAFVEEAPGGFRVRRKPFALRGTGAPGFLV